MSEELSLPGIDSPAPAAAPAVEPAAPAVEQDDNSTHSASVDTGADAPAGDAPTETNEQRAEKRSRGGFQNRINELVAREREANREKQQLSSLLEMVIKGGMSPQQAQAKAPNPEAPPRPEDYARWQDFEVANTKFVARQEIRQELAQRAAQEQQQRSQWEHQTQQQQRAAAEEHLHSVTGAQMNEASARYPDYAEVIESCPLHIPVSVEAAMAITGNAGDVAYYLARNPRVIQQLSQMPDVAVAHHITRISNAMRSSASSVSNAPAPGSPVGNRGTAINAYPKDATPEQHLAWEKANKRASEKRA